MFATIITIILLLWVAAQIIGVRNEAVYKERIRMTNLVFSQEEWEHYRELKNSVGYDTMMCRFWIWPVSKMWPQELQDLK